MNRSEQFTACLLVVGYPPTMPALSIGERLDDELPSRRYSYRHPKWTNAVERFYRELCGRDVEAGAIHDFVHSFIGWLQE